MAVETFNPNPIAYKAGIDPQEEAEFALTTAIVNYYLGATYPTKALATAGATGKQKQLITVTADESAAGITKHYIYEGVTAGTLVAMGF